MRPYRGNICISGLTAAGKTTHSLMLAGLFGLNYVSGSHTLLQASGLSGHQAREFWATEAAAMLCTEESFDKVEAELRRIESCTTDCVFDTATMPWRAQRACLKIWLESDTKSRISKSIASHRGRSRLAVNEYSEMISRKDKETAKLYNRLYGFNIGPDEEVFDVIIDISSFVEDSTFEATQKSISAVSEIITPIVGWYLTGSGRFEREMVQACRTYASALSRNTLLDGLSV